MSYELQCLALKQKDLTSTQKSILFYLAFRANEHGECWPSTRSITSDTGFHRNKVIKTLKELIEKNLLTKEDNKKGRTKSVPIYKLILSGTNGYTTKDGKWYKNTSQVVQRVIPLSGTNGCTGNIYIEYTKECGTNYQEYISKFNADIKLGLKPKDEKPLTFTEWKEIDML
jgi:DNA-binding transcriptional regulator YhcF (GntR family)